MADNWMDQAIWNSYQVLTGWMTMDELVEHLEIRREEATSMGSDPEDISVMPIFLIPPGEDADNQDIDSMIAHFEEMEAYEECAELLKLKK
jgi:hypothetical protein|tara:strand:+ start:247 stop:519 length:273 start_codon:yes stop_codon:yes gene_type:complete